MLYYDTVLQGSPLVGYLYDAGVLWLKWLNYTLENNLDYTDGAALLAFTNNVTFTGIYKTASTYTGRYLTCCREHGELSGTA